MSSTDVDIEDIVRQYGHLIQETTRYIASTNCMYVEPKKYHLVNITPPHTRPKRIYKYVEDYYTPLWEINSLMCVNCKTRKACKHFKYRALDKRKWTMQVSDNCIECIENHVAYKKELSLADRLWAWLDYTMHHMLKDLERAKDIKPKDRKFS